MRLFKCTTVGLHTFYVVAANELAARSAVEYQWHKWNYPSRKGAVVNIEALAETGQYPDVPGTNDTWLLIGEDNELFRRTPPMDSDTRRSYWDAIEALIKLVKPDALTPEERERFDAIKDEHGWDGLSCSCGGGWLVGHAYGCPEDTPNGQ